MSKGETIVYAAFYAGILSLMWSSTEARRILHIEPLVFIALGIGIAVTLLANIVCHRRLPLEGRDKIAGVIMLSVGVLSAVPAFIFISNNRLGNSAPEWKSFRILDKKTAHGKSGFSYFFIVDDGGRNEQIEVCQCEWKILTPGCNYKVQVWTGIWGYRFIAPIVDRLEKNSC